MINLRGVLAVFFFEWNRSLTLSRLSAWVVLVLFPPSLMAIMRYQGVTLDAQIWGLMLFGLIPMVICLLGLLLWATPALHSELEGKTWIYLAVRPQGRVSVLLGKYLTAITLTGLAGFLAASFCIPLIAPIEPRADVVEMGRRQLVPVEPLRLWCVLLALVSFSCVSYGAIFSFFAVVFHKRAMVIAVAYTLIFEFLVSFIPAMINQLTVQYHLRSVLFLLMDWQGDVPDDAKLFFGTQPLWQHLLFFLTYVLVILAAAILFLRSREYVSAEDVAG